MVFHWIHAGKPDKKLKKRCIELEYSLRPEITRILLPTFDENECCIDFSCLHFDVEVATQKVSVSNKTPKKYREMIPDDFEEMLNSSIHSVENFSNKKPA